MGKIQRFFLQMFILPKIAVLGEFALIAYGVIFAPHIQGYLVQISALQGTKYLTQLVFLRAQRQVLVMNPATTITTTSINDKQHSRIDFTVYKTSSFACYCFKFQE